MLNDGENDEIPSLEFYDFDTGEYTIGPGNVVATRFSFEGPDPDTGDVWMHLRHTTNRHVSTGWLPVKLTPNDRRTLIAILDMADDAGDWTDGWHTRYRGTGIRSACSQFIEALRTWARSQWRSAISTKKASTSWRSIFPRT